jgi:general secretion pathway protein M
MTLAPRASKLLAIAMLVTAAGAGYALVIDPLVTLYGRQQERLDMLALRAARLAAPAADAPDLKRELDTLRTRIGITPFWAGRTDAIAAAGLQQAVQALIAAQNAAIESTEVLPAARQGTLHKIALKVRFACEIDQLERIVQTIETSSPALMIDHLTVSKSEAPQPGASPLSIDLEVFGFAEPPLAGRPAT